MSAPNTLAGHVQCCFPPALPLFFTGMSDLILPPALVAEVGIALCKEPLSVNVSFIFFLSFLPCLSLSIAGVVQSSQAWDAALALAGY